jgi:sugar O-acyltransferase (sialic acid O-acetyltransferase NeuD family)
MNNRANNFKKNIAIVGAGAFGREILCHIRDCENENNLANKVKYIFLDDNFPKNSKLMDCEVLKIKNFTFSNYNVIVSIGSSTSRSDIVKILPDNINYSTFVHPSVIFSDDILIDEGSIVSPGCIFTTNIAVGKHAHFNLHVTVGHDTKIGNFFSAAPGVNISGNCNIGNNVYIGTGAAIKQGITIVDNVIIGMGAIVVKDILEEGTYIGNPSRRL